MNKWVFRCRAEDLSDRYEVWLEVAVTQLGTDETTLKKYAAYVYKTRVCANLPALGRLEGSNACNTVSADAHAVYACHASYDQYN